MTGLVLIYDTPDISAWAVGYTLMVEVYAKKIPARCCDASGLQNSLSMFLLMSVVGGSDGADDAFGSDIVAGVVAVVGEILVNYTFL